MEVTTFEIAMVGFYVLESIIGLAQCLIIWMGLRQMSRSLELRERESARRHEEVMRNHEEVMKNHAENMKKHDESMTALKTLIERTGK